MSICNYNKIFQIIIAVIVILCCSCDSRYQHHIIADTEAVIWSIDVPNGWLKKTSKDDFFGLSYQDDSIIALINISHFQNTSKANQYLTALYEAYDESSRTKKYRFIAEKVYKTANKSGKFFIREDLSNFRYWFTYLLKQDNFVIHAHFVGKEYTPKVLKMIDKMINSICIKSPQVNIMGDEKVISFITESTEKWSIKIPTESTFQISKNSIKIDFKNDLTLVSSFRCFANVAKLEERYNFSRNQLIKESDLQLYNKIEHKSNTEIYYAGDTEHPQAVYWFITKSNNLIFSFAASLNDKKTLTKEDILCANQIINSINLQIPR